MSTHILRLWKRLQYLHRGIGLKRMTLRIAQKIVAPVYRHEVAYIVVRDVKQRGSPKLPKGNNRGHVDTECVVLETLESLKQVLSELPSSIPIDSLINHLTAGPERILILARRLKVTGSGKQVIGYRRCETGIFSALGVRAKIAGDILFVHHTEILPDYRGHRIQQAIRDATYRYCQRNGLHKICGVVLAHNLPSIMAHTRNREDRTVGVVEVVSVLGGLFKSTTPMEKIKSAIEDSQT